MAGRFDADTDGYTTTTGLPASTTWTVCCWFQPVVDRNNASTVWLMSDVTLQDGANAQLSLAADADGLNFSARTFTVSLNPIAGAVNTWYRSGVVLNGANNGTHYIAAAGSALTSASNTTTFGATSTNAKLFIGSSIWTSEFLNGRIAAFKMWQAALTQAEVEAELAQYVPVRTANLLRFHPFIGPSTSDFSGNGNNLTAGSSTPGTEDGPPIPWQLPTLSRPYAIPRAANF